MDVAMDTMKTRTGWVPIPLCSPTRILAEADLVDLLYNEETFTLIISCMLYSEPDPNSRDITSEISHFASAWDFLSGDGDMVTYTIFFLRGILVFLLVCLKMWIATYSIYERIVDI